MGGQELLEEGFLASLLAGHRSVQRACADYEAGRAALAEESPFGLISLSIRSKRKARRASL